MTILLFTLFFFCIFALNAAIKFILATFSLVEALGIMWYHTLPIAAAIVMIPFAWRHLRAMWSRLRFVSRLRRICRKNKLKCKVKTPSLLSIFFRYQQSDIRVEADGVTYSVKFFGGNVLRRFVHLQSPELAETSKFFVMPVIVERNKSRLGTWVFGKVAMMRGKFFINDLEYGRKKLKNVVSFEENAVPVLLFSPAPMRLTGVVGNTSKPLGSAEVYQGVTIYEAEGFLRFLSRCSSVV